MSPQKISFSQRRMWAFQDGTQGRRQRRKEKKEMRFSLQRSLSIQNLLQKERMKWNWIELISPLNSKNYKQELFSKAMPTKSHIETFEEIPNKFFSLYQHFGTLDEHIKKFNSEGLELIDSCSLGVLRSEYPVQDNDIWCHTRALEGVIY